MLARRTPLKRTGFASRASAHRQRERAPRTVHTPIAPDLRARVSMARVSDQVQAVPKTHAQRNARLLAMANGKPCLFRLPGICNGDPATTVACHGNGARFGKGGARKADDHQSAWGCFACHTWIDQGNGTAEERLAAFLNAHQRQVNEWKQISTSTTEHPADRRAAQWALDRLEEVVC